MTIDFTKVADVFEKSPKKIQDLMFSDDIARKIEDIAISNNLEEEKFPLLVDEVGYVILGLKQRFLFEKSLLEIGIETAIAQKIAKKTDEVIFTLLEEIKKETEKEEPQEPKTEIENNTVSGMKGWIDRFLTELASSPTDILDKSNIFEKTLISIKSGNREDLPSYIKSLKDEVKNSIFNTLWIERIGEISKKYNLGIDQSKMLLENVFFVMTGLQKSENFEENVTSDLGISKIIAEQIMLDVENRIFNYFIKQLESRAETKEITPEPIVSEIKQENILGATTPLPMNTANSPTPNYSSKKVILDDELVQSPVPIPKFNAVPMEDTESVQDFMPNIAPKPNTGGIVEAKLKKYDVDPYREQLN